MASTGAADTVREPATAARFRLTCWGDFALKDLATGSDIRPRGRKSRAVIAYLAMHPGRAVSRERLTALLWGDRGEEQARASLRQAVHELRPYSHGDDALVEVGRQHLLLHPQRLDTDLAELGRHAAHGAFAALVGAIPDPTDRLFADLDGLDSGLDDWLAIERTRQLDRLATLLEDAVAAAVNAGMWREARALRTRLGELDPSRDMLPLTGPVLLPKNGHAAPPPPAAPEPEPAAGLPATWRKNMARLVGTMLVLALLVLVAWNLPRAGPAPPASIAVLPFRNLGQAHPFFAEGLSEEISARLAREPGLRVAGRTSSRHIRESSSDLTEIGRRLGVRYVLEGSIRSDSEQVRVNVALAQVSDGMQLWSETFDGKLDDVLAIQDRIGASVAAALGHRFAPAQRKAGPSGAVYSAYLTARGLIRERNPQAMTAAREQLERALALDPGFAPAWSSMAQVRRWEGNAPGPAGRRANAEALAYARRALALAPDLAEAHGVLGMILDFDDPVAQRHIRRAAALDPNNAEYQFWLGHVHANEPDFPKMQAAYRRAFAIDPLWTHAYDYAIMTAWRMGQRQEAVGIVRRVEREGSRYDAHMARASLAAHAGDLSGAVTELGAARAATSDAGKQARAAWERGGFLFQLGLVDQAREEWQIAGGTGARNPQLLLPIPVRHADHLALKRGELPTLAEIEAVNERRGDPARQSVMAAMAKSLIRAGRAGDLVTLYDSRDGLLGLSRERLLPARIGVALQHAPLVAAALIAAGRGDEANRLLRHSDRLIEAALRRSGGSAPAHFHAEAAQTWALLGKQDVALGALDRARRNGWVNGHFVAGDLIDEIGDEPAFAGLRGDSRFEAIRARINADMAREQREARALLQ